MRGPMCVSSGVHPQLGADFTKRCGTSLRPMVWAKWSVQAKLVGACLVRTLLTAHTLRSHFAHIALVFRSHCARISLVLRSHFARIALVLRSYCARISLTLPRSNFPWLRTRTHGAFSTEHERTNGAITAADQRPALGDGGATMRCQISPLTADAPCTPHAG